MDTYKTKSKTKVIMLLVFAMLFQIVGPVTFSVYAETVRSEDGLRAEVDGTTLKWVLDSDLNLNSGERVFTFKGDFELSKQLKGQITANGGENLGDYTISEVGLVNFTLSDEFVGSLRGKETSETREEVRNEAVEQANEALVEDLSQVENLDQATKAIEGTEVETLPETITEAGIDEAMPEDNGEEVDKVRINFKGSIDLGDSLILSEPKESSPRDLGKQLGKDFNHSGIMVDVNLYNDGKKIEEIDLSKIEEFEYRADFYIGDGYELKQGEILSIDISMLKNLEGIEIISGQEYGKINFEVKTIKEGKEEIEEIEIASYTIDEDSIDISFNDNIEYFNTKQERQGHVRLFFSVTKTSGSVEIIEEVKLNDEEDKTFTLIRKTESLSVISKEGVYDSETDTITWKIVVNSGNFSLKNVKFEDDLPDGLSVIKVIRDGEEIEYTNINRLDLDLGDITGETIIELVTKVTDKTISKFKNIAKLTSDSIKGTLDAESSLDIDSYTGISKSGEIVNSGEDKEVGSLIRWTINFERRSEDSSDSIVDTLTLPDNLPNNVKLALVDGSFKLDGEVIDNYNIEVSGNVITFKNLPVSNKTQTIEYETRVLYGGSDIDTSGYKISNKAEHDLESSGSEVSVKRGSIIQKSDGKVWGENGKTYVDWTITINEGNEAWEDVVLLETLPNSLELESIFIGKEEFNIKYKTNPIRIELGKIKEKTIIYVRTILKEDATIDDIEENKAEVTWKIDSSGLGIIGGDIPEGGSLESTGKLTKENLLAILSKGNDKINYETKTVDWKINYITYNEDIKGVVIEDELSGNHSYEGEIEVKLNGKTLETNYYRISDYKDKKSFEIILDDNIKSNKKYNNIKITYKTKFDLSQMKDTKDFIQNRLSNKVVVTNNGKSLEGNSYIDIDKTISNNGKKSVSAGFKEDRIMSWTAELNHKGKSIQTIQDTLTGNHSYIGDVKVFKAKLKDDGSLTSTGEMVSFTKEIKSKEMAISLSEKVDYPIIIEYQTKANGLSEEEYSNKIEFNNNSYVATGKHKEYKEFITKKALNDRNGKVIKGDVLEWELEVNKSLSEIKNFNLEDNMSEGLVFIKDSLKVMDSKGEDKTNEFILSDRESGRGFKLTKADGITGKYKITYKTLVYADPHAEVKDISNKVSISGIGIKEGNEKTEKFNLIGRSSAGGYAVSRPEDSYEIELVKVDTNGDPIESPVKFKLITETRIGSEVFTSEEDLVLEDGKTTIELEKNEYNSYFIREIEAPEGYALVDEIVEIDLKKAENNKIQLKIVNSEKTQVTGKKIWLGGGPAVKPTIELQLYRESINVNRESINVNREALGEPIKLTNGQEEHTWYDLPKYDENNVVYKYTVDELEVPANYRKTISGDGLTVSNTFVPPGKPITPVDPDPVDPDPVDPVDPDPKKPEIITPVDPDPVKPIEPTEPETTDPVDPTEPEEPGEVPEVPTETIVIEPPAKGKVTVDKDGNWIYTPNPGQRGKDRFKIRKPDGTEEVFEIDLDEIPEGTINIKNGKPVLGKKKLPKTGNTSNILFYSLGVLFIGAGLSIKKKKQA